MPQLLIFAACRKVLVDEQDKTVSLIGLFEQVEIQVPPDTEIPDQLVAPLDWSMYSWWAANPEDKEKEFEQRITIISPIGEEVAAGNNQFTFTAERHRITLNSPNFPVTIPGVWILKLSLRPLDGEWQDITTYSVRVLHNIVELAEDK